MKKSREFESDNDVEGSQIEGKERPMTLLEIGQARRKEKMQKAKTRFSGFGAKIKNVFKRIGGAGNTALDAAFAAPEVAKIVGQGVKKEMLTSAENVIEVGKAVGHGVKVGAETGAGLAVEGAIMTGRGVKRGVEAAGAGLEKAGQWLDKKDLEVSEWTDRKYEAMGRWTQEQWQNIQEKGRDVRQGFADGVEKARATYTHFRENRAEAAKQRKLADLRAEMNRSLEAIRWNEARYKEAEEQMQALEGIDNLSEELASASAE